MINQCRVFLVQCTIIIIIIVIMKKTFATCSVHIGRDHAQYNVEISFHHSKYRTRQHSTPVVVWMLEGLHGTNAREDFGHI